MDIIVELKRRKAAGTLHADLPLFDGDFSTLSAEAVADAEARLGFALPALLRRIYTEVANGGFGYSYGLLGLKGGMRNEQGDDAVALYLAYRESDPNDEHWVWPEGLLPVVHLGCAMYHCVECHAPRAPMVWFEPNPHVVGESWEDSLIPFCSSLEEYLTAWLMDKDVFEEFLSQT